MPAATTSVVLIQNAPMRSAQMMRIEPIFFIQPGSAGSFPLRAGRLDQNRSEAARSSTPSATWAMLAAFVGVLPLEKS